MTDQFSPPPLARPLDIERPDELVEYLRLAGHIDAHERPRIAVLSGGISNRTVLVERDSGESWVLKQALDRLRVPVEWFSDPERVHREALGMQWLTELAPPGSIPAFLFEDHHHHLVAMRAVPQPHANWKELLLEGRLEMERVEQFGRLLGTIHRNGSLQFARLPLTLADRAIFQSMRVEPYYLYPASRMPDVAGFLCELVAAMRARQITVVHGDFSPKNILVHEGRLILLDHEVIHLGDPAVDVGFSLTHLLAKANHHPHQRAEFASAAVAHWRVYRSTLGDLDWVAGLEDHVVRQTLAHLIARVAGRSRLEYLDARARDRQLRAACALVSHPPEGVEDLIHSFVHRL